MKKIVILIFITGFISLYATAQESYINKRLNFKMGYARYPEASLGENTSNFRIGANYGFTDYIEAGIYVGYGIHNNYYRVTPGEGTMMFNSNTLFYGINGNFHILPYFIKKPNFRFDVYASGKLGAYNSFAPENSILSNGMALDYGIYGGVSFYPWKHLGLYAEYGYGNKTNLRYGITLKF